MKTIWQNVRYGLRMLRENPGFTVSVIVVLALGIGANTAIFSVVHSVLFKPLPYNEPDRIVMIRQQKLQQGTKNIGASHRTSTYWRQHNQVFENIAAMGGRSFYVNGLEKPRNIIGLCCITELFLCHGHETYARSRIFPRR